MVVNGFDLEMNVVCHEAVGVKIKRKNNDEPLLGFEIGFMIKIIIKNR
jgi:hypothetical protein